MRTILSNRRWLAVLPAALTALMALQCIEAPLSPVAPTWQTQLSTPLADIFRTLADAFKDTSSVKRDAAGGFYFQDTQAGDPVSLVPLYVQPDSTAEQVVVGVIQVAGIPSQSVSVTATSLGMAAGTWPAPPAPGFPGLSTTVPATDVGDTTTFAYAVIQQGTMTLSVTNTLPMDVTFTGNLQLRNNISTDSLVIASFPIGTVAPGVTKTVTASLAGKTMWGRLRVSSVGVNIAAKTGPFTIDGNSGIQIGVSSTPLTVTSARAVVPSQNVVSINDTVIVIDDSVFVAQAHFSAGGFSTRVVNNLDVQVGVRIRLNNFESIQTGQPLSILKNISPRSIFDSTFSMPSLRLVNPTADTIGTRVQFSVGVETITSAGQKSTINATDFVRAEFNPQNQLVLKNITGRIKPTVLLVSSGASGVDIGDAADKFAGQFTFDSVRIAVRLGLTGGYPVRYSLALEARNRKTNTVASLPLPPPVGAAPGDTMFIPSPGSMTEIALGNSQGLNTFLSKFFPNFPDTFIVRGRVTINPGFTSQQIADTSKLYQAVHMYFPLKLGLAGGRIEDKIPLDEGSNFPTEFAQDIRQASLRFSVGNRIPAQLGFRLRLIGRATPTSPLDTLLRIPTDGSSRTIAAAPVDANGNATSEVSSHFDIALTTAQVEQFNKADTMYFRLDLQTSGAGTQPVRFRTADYIRIRMSGNMVYIVNNQN